MRKSTVLFSVFLCCFYISLHAQESVNAGGGDVVEPEIIIAYSIGEVFYDPIAYAGGSLTPGIQQAYEIAFVSALPEVKAGLQIRAYPNPATDYLLLSFPGYKSEKHTMTLFDPSGRNIYLDEIKNELSRLEVQNLAPGTYFLQIANKEQIIQLFKIIKK
jgi:hypothetical protein